MEFWEMIKMTKQLKNLINGTTLKNYILANLIYSGTKTLI